MRHQFTVKAGRHVEDGRTYKQGETVVSHRNLMELFPAKFALVTRPAPALETEQETLAKDILAATPSQQPPAGNDSQPASEAAMLVQGTSGGRAPGQRPIKAPEVPASASAGKGKGKKKSAPVVENEDDWDKDE